MSEKLTAIPFERYWDPCKLGSDPAFEQRIKDGEIPQDVLFRLLSIGQWERDPNAAPDSRVRLYESVVADMLTADEPGLARQDTQAIVWSDTLPDAVVDLAKNDPDLYAALPELYWTKSQLAQVIRKRRAEEGKTITTALPDSWWTPEELEWRRCSGLAQPIWRALVQRVNPKIIKHPDWFHPSGVVSFNAHYNLSERTVRRRALSKTRIRDGVLYDLYGEIQVTGMRGIGSVGKIDIAAMLAPEHPDIAVSLARAAGISVDMAN